MVTDEAIGVGAGQVDKEEAQPENQARKAGRRQVAEVAQRS